MSVCLSLLICMVGVIFAHVDTLYGFYGYSFLCLVGCFSIIIWTPAVLSVLCACVLYFCIYTCSAQLSIFHIERRSRNTLIIIIAIIISIITQCSLTARTIVSLLTTDQRAPFFKSLSCVAFFYKQPFMFDKCGNHVCSGFLKRLS